MDRLHLAEGLLLVGVEQHKHDHQQQLEKETDKPENILLICSLSRISCQLIDW